MPNKIPLVYIFTAAIFSLILIANPFYIVDQRKQALVFQFGEVVKVIKKPGLHFRIPLIQDILYLENQILNCEVDKKEVIAKDKKKFIVNAFAKYRITDPLKFYQAVGNVDRVRTRLSPIFESSLRDVLGKFPLAALLTNERTEIMVEIRELLADKSRSFGIEIIDVRIIRADLPSENKNAVFRRMQTDREKVAKEHRAEGAEEAQRIRSSADKAKQIILAEATKQAEEMRGEGDAIAAKIFADSYSADPEFYSFYRSMQAYKNSLKQQNTKIILSPNSDFLKYFSNINQ